MTKNVIVVARFAIIAALILVAYALDTAISYLMAGMPVRIAVVTLIVVLTIIQLFDLKTAVFTAACFGLYSFLFAYFMPNLTSQAFRNPLISILPRVVIGFTSYFSFKGIKKATYLSDNLFLYNILPRAIAGAIGVLTNTVLVLSMMAVFGGDNIIDKVIKFIISFNFLIEFAVGLLLVPSLSLAATKPIKRMNI